MLFATEANTVGYETVFALRDTSNYKWAAGTQTDGNGCVVLRWAISPAKSTDLNLVERIESVYGTEVTVRATSSLGGTVTYEYASYDENILPENVSEWSSDKPVAAGTYRIKAVAVSALNSNGIKNFEDTVKYSVLFIDKANLTVTAAAYGMYGDIEIGNDRIVSKDNVEFRYNISGYRYADTRSVLTVDETKVRYRLVNMLASTHISAGEHEAFVTIVTDDDNCVIGMSADNYYIRAAAGTFSVSRRPVEITIGAAGGVYTSKVNLDGAKKGMAVTKGNLAAGDTLDGLNIALETAASKDSRVGGYAITATDYNNANYDVTFVASVYTVSPLDITLTIEAKNGTYHGDAASVEIKSITSTTEGYDAAKVRAELDGLLRFTYGGIANDGTVYSGSEVPTLAGIYTAAVVGASADYNLTNLPIVHFNVEKQSIDVSRISAASVTYDMTAHTPVISDGVYGADYYTVANVSFVNTGTHGVPLTLSDSNNTKWSSTDGATADIPFVIEKAKNSLVGELTIAGWTYGKYDAGVNAPRAVTRFGSENILYAYSAVREGSYKDGTYTLNVPALGDVKTYYVIAVVAGTENYDDFESAPVAFAITKAALNAPVLVIVGEGEGKNDTYTGGDLLASVSGFDSALMKITYDGMVSVNGDNVTVYALNAGVYSVKFSLVNPDNYAWAEGGNASGEAVREWTVARKKIARPTENTDLFVVNGRELVYLPEGYDPSIMKISGNTTGYGGEFTATVTLADTLNYEWEDGTDGQMEFTWNVVGVNTVFAVVISTVATLAAVGIAGVAAECVLIYRKKKRLEAEEAEEDDAAEGGANA